MRSVRLSVSCSLIPLGYGSSIVLVMLLEWLDPHVFPFGLDTFWKFPDALWPAVTGALSAMWPVLAFELLWSLISISSSRPIQHALAQTAAADDRILTITPTFLLVNSVLEELVFRWLIFFAAIAGATFVDYIALGFTGVHPVRWVFSEVLIPAADFATWHRLHAVLTSGPWTVGAALLASNGRFRSGHFYQGPVGWVTSWYFGMFLFLTTFTYGLPLAIAIHAGYNLAILILHLTLVGTLPRIRLNN